MSNLVGITIGQWWAVGASGLLLLVFLVQIIRLSHKLKQFEKAHLALETFLSGESVDDLLRENLKRTKTLEEKLKDAGARLSKAEDRLKTAMDKAAVVRFNAFDNMGSDLSFSMALVNQEGSGLVLSSINSREESRVYAKPVSRGESQYPLIEEERKALEKALEPRKYDTQSKGMQNGR